MFFMKKKTMDLKKTSKTHLKSIMSLILMHEQRYIM